MTSHHHPCVSIVIPNWNGKAMLKTCLQSLSRLTYPNCEIIVVDNASTDGSSEMVRKDFPDAKLFVNEKNLGFAAGCNVGMRASKGELIAIFNNDAIAESTWLTKLVEALTSSYSIGMVGGIILRFMSKDIVSSAGVRMDVITGMTWQLGYGEKLANVGNIEDIDFLSGCALLAKREVVEKIGLLDEGLFLYGDDVDWNLRARRAGYESRLVPSAIVWHMDSVSRKRIPLKGHYFIVRGAVRICFKHYPIRYAITTLIFQSVVLGLIEITLQRRSALYLLERMRAVAWNLRRLRDTMKERRRVESLGNLKWKSRLPELLRIAREHEQRTFI